MKYGTVDVSKSLKEAAEITIQSTHQCRILNFLAVQYYPIIEHTKIHILRSFN